MNFPQSLMSHASIGRLIILAAVSIAYNVGRLFPDEDGSIEWYLIATALEVVALVIGLIALPDYQPELTASLLIVAAFATFRAGWYAFKQWLGLYSVNAASMWRLLSFGTAAAVVAWTLWG